MNFIQKNEAFLRLKSGDHLEADRALLAKMNPKSQVLTVKYLDREKERKEILYALLDVANEEEIVANRMGKRIVKTNTGRTAVIKKKKSKKSKKGKKR